MIEIKDIPKGWKEKSLGEVFTIERGGSPRPIEDFITNDENGINWIKIGDTKDIVKYIERTKEKIKPEGAKRSRMVYVDDFLLSNSMSFGRPYIMKTTGCIHDGWLVIRKNEEVDNNYLYYILSSSYLYQQFSNLAKGSTVKNLNIEAVKQAIIKFPPLPEQQAIVAKIEELLSELENGKQQLLIAQQQLKVYRQSLLSAATSGMITGTNNTFVNAITIGEPKQRNQVWEVVKLIDISKLESGHTPRKDTSAYWENGDVYWLSLQDIRALDGTIVLDTKYKTNKLGIENSSARLLPIGTVCFCRDISLGYVTILGKVMSTTQHFANWICSERINNKYLMYCFMASRDSLIRQGQGTTVKTIYMPDLKELRIQLPTIKEQQLIVSELESKLTVCDKIEETINQSLQQAETLRQSILKKAFEGKLI
jgi:type I restriction enzyme S subunit